MANRGLALRAATGTIYLIFPVIWFSVYQIDITMSFALYHSNVVKVILQNAIYM